MRAMTTGSKLELPGFRRATKIPPFAEAEEIVGEKHQYATNWDQAPTPVNLAWRPFRRAFSVSGHADVTIAGDVLRVHQELTLPPPAKSAGAATGLR